MDWLARDFFGNSSILFYESDRVGCGEGWKEDREPGVWVLVIFDEELIVMCKWLWDQLIRTQVKGTRPGVPEEFPEMITGLSLSISCQHVFRLTTLRIVNGHQRKWKTKQNPYKYFVPSPWASRLPIWFVLRTFIWTKVILPFFSIPHLHDIY